MGFTTAQALKGLEATGGDMSKCVEWCLSHPEVVNEDEHIAVILQKMTVEGWSSDSEDDKSRQNEQNLLHISGSDDIKGNTLFDVSGNRHDSIQPPDPRMCSESMKSDCKDRNEISNCMDKNDIFNGETELIGGQDDEADPSQNLRKNVPENVPAVDLPRIETPANPVISGCKFYNGDMHSDTSDDTGGSETSQHVKLQNASDAREICDRGLMGSVPDCEKETLQTIATNKLEPESCGIERITLSRDSNLDVTALPTVINDKEAFQGVEKTHDYDDQHREKSENADQLKNDAKTSALYREMKSSEVSMEHLEAASPDLLNDPPTQTGRDCSFGPSLADLSNVQISDKIVSSGIRELPDSDQDHNSIQLCENSQVTAKFRSNDRDIANTNDSEINETDSMLKNKVDETVDRKELDEVVHENFDQIQVENALKVADIELLRADPSGQSLREEDAAAETTVHPKNEMKMPDIGSAELGGSAKFDIGDPAGDTCSTIDQSKRLGNNAVENCGAELDTDPVKRSSSELVSALGSESGHGVEEVANTQAVTEAWGEDDWGDVSGSNTGACKVLVTVLRYERGLILSKDIQIRKSTGGAR